MVKEEVKKGKTYFRCEDCGFFYETRELAQKCQNFCEEHKSCSLEITKHAIQGL